MKGAAIFRAKEVGEGHSNIAARFEASGASPELLGEEGMNYAIYADTGVTMASEALLSGRRARVVTIPAGTTMIFDPTLSIRYNWCKLFGGNSGSPNENQRIYGRTFAGRKRDPSSP